MIDRLFLKHPRSLNETYYQHMRTAAGFGASLMRAGIACFAHAIIPALFTNTASRELDRLHTSMVQRAANHDESQLTS